MAEEQLSFQAEVSRLLEIVAHSLYSDKDVFLRELISNAADASDRHRYLVLTNPEQAGSAPAAYRVSLAPDAAARTLTIADDGIGMNREELVENLGTIAKSGTGRFMASLTGDAKHDLSLIGQFGVGFYAAFMVADQVEVISRKANEAAGWRWRSDGQGSFHIAPAERADHGTTIILHLKEDASPYLDPDKLRQIVRRYSDHIDLAIILLAGEKEEALNSASALWTRSKSDMTPEAATQFYQYITHGGDTPWATVHIRAEGSLEYSSLLFIPSVKPFDLFTPERKHSVKLYARRVFITENAAELIPGYLRFVKGVVDSADLPLNVSREMLQNNPLLARIRANLTRKILAEIESRAKDEGYASFWQNFGAVLKEGLYEERDEAHQATLLKLARFATTQSDAPISLADYIARMKPGQEAIYTISGDSPERVKASPQLEGYRAKGIEVILLTDPVDEFWAPMIGNHEGKPFRSVTRGAADLSHIQGAEGAADAPGKNPATPAESSDISGLIALFKLTLGGEVKDVRPSQRLTDSAVCLVADEGDMDMQLEKLLRQHKQLDQVSRRVLEINPAHPVICGLAEQLATGSTELGDAAWLLLDQARILEGDPLPDPRGFARRLDWALLRK